ncbi:TPA: phage baseplate assembly protein V [Escherichia coli]
MPVTVSVSIHWKNWSPSGVPLAAYRLKRSKHHEEIIPFTDAERVAGADAGTVPDLSGIKTASVTASDSVTATVPVVMVKASTRVTLDTPEVVCTNRLITGTLEVQKGGTMRGNIEHTGGELSSNGKVLHTHKHPGDSGGTTGSPL